RPRPRFAPGSGIQLNRSQPVTKLDRSVAVRREPAVSVGDGQRVNGLRRAGVQRIRFGVYTRTTPRTVVGMSGIGDLMSDQCVAQLPQRSGVIRSRGSG